MIYIDTSVIVKLYFREARSKATGDWLKQNNEAIPITFLHELELTNAVQLKRFRNEIRDDIASRVMARFNNHEHIGIYFRPTVAWPSVLHAAITLSKTHSADIGSRSLDILHVATAMTMGATRFITFDHRQSTLATREGLDVHFL